MILSRGSALVGSGVSINEAILIANVKKSTLASQWLVCDGIINEGGIVNVKC